MATHNVDDTRIAVLDGGASLEPHGVSLSTSHSQQMIVALASQIGA